MIKNIYENNAEAFKRSEERAKMLQETQGIMNDIYDDIIDKSKHEYNLLINDVLYEGLGELKSTDMIHSIIAKDIAKDIPLVHEANRKNPPKRYAKYSIPQGTPVGPYNSKSKETFKEVITKEEWFCNDDDLKPFPGTGRWIIIKLRESVPWENSFIDAFVVEKFYITEMT